MWATVCIAARKARGSGGSRPPLKLSALWPFWPFVVIFDSRQCRCGDGGPIPGGPCQYDEVHQYSVVRRAWGAGALAMFLIFAATRAGGILSPESYQRMFAVCANCAGINKLRVIALRGGKVELRRADRKHPDFALVKPSVIHYTITDKIPLYHPEGIGVGLRRWGVS